MSGTADLTIRGSSCNTQQQLSFPTRIHHTRHHLFSITALTGQYSNFNTCGPHSNSEKVRLTNTNHFNSAPLFIETGFLRTKEQRRLTSRVREQVLVSLSKACGPFENLLTDIIRRVCDTETCYS